MNDRLLSITEVQKILGIGRYKSHELIRTGKISSLRWCNTCLTLEIYGQFLIDLFDLWYADAKKGEESFMGTISVSVYALTDGKKRHRYRYEIASTDGQRRYVQKAGFKTRKECKESAEKDYQSYKTYGIPINPSRLSVNDSFLNVWLKQDVEMRCK